MSVKTKDACGCCTDTAQENITGTAGCCGPQCCDKTAHKKIVIDFLYLDLSVCCRCQGTDGVLDAALSDVDKVLDAAGVEVVVNKVNVISEDLAVKYKFVSSPTIRINGRDIQADLRESLCESCGDLCGDNVDCRVWVYQGKEFTEPPKAMIIEAILKEVYVYGPGRSEPAEDEYVVPDNLKKYYHAMKNKASADLHNCC